MKMLFLLLAFCTSSAFAVDLEFAFDVNSSGPSIYPCDAGIKHMKHNERVCYDRVTQNSCDPSLCTQETQCNCVCTGGAGANGDGEYRQDFLKASYATWTENGEYAPSSVITTAVSAAESTFNRIFSGKNEWDKQLTNLTFNLGSERYGSEFYLDVCYRGPQIEYYQAYLNAQSSDINSFPNFAIKLQSTVTDLVSTNGLKYSALADLKVKTEVTCDVQGLGEYIYAHSGTATSSGSTGSNGNNGNSGSHSNNGNSGSNSSNNSSGTYVYDNAQAHQITGITGGDKNFSTAYTAFNAGGNVFLLNDWVNLGNANTPRFCKIRYSFIENKRNNAANPLSQIRKWQNQQARICTFTDISEAEGL